MSHKSKKIYHRRNPVKVILVVLGNLILTALILFMLVFFGFKKYAVYTDEGVTLEIPWLEEYRKTDSANTVIDHHELTWEPLQYTKLQ